MHNPYAGRKVTRSWEQHIADGDNAGIDYSAPEGTPIIAPCDGVFRFFWNGPAGYDAVITRPDGSTERQCHNMDNDLARSLNGQQVAEGQHVSYSGNTGNSTGPHIHANGRDANGTRVPPFGGLTTASDAPRPFDNTQEHDMTHATLFFQKSSDGNQAYIVQLPNSLQIVDSDIAAAIGKSQGIDITKLPVLTEYDFNAIRSTFEADQKARAASASVDHDKLAAALKKAGVFELTIHGTARPEALR